MSGRESEWIQSNDKKQTKNNASRIKENMGISKLCFLSVEKKNNLFLFKIYENYNYFGMELDIYPVNYQYFDHHIATLIASITLEYFWNKYFLNNADLLSLNSMRQLFY